jgi:hypothetical protein
LVGCSTPSNTGIIFCTINNHDIFVWLHKWQENQSIDIIGLPK